MTTGGNAKVRLAALSTPAEAAPAGDLAQALADTKGEDGFYYTDLSALVRPALAGAASAAQANGAGQGMGAMMGAVGAMLANAHLGTWGSHRGGQTLSFTWRVPMATFQSISTLVRGFMGMAAGGGRPPQ
jgi:uncharacterized membrane protein YeaQ/YmgE (transglycosylase-associated protein family)